jgi:hypothetical protein
MGVCAAPLSVGKTHQEVRAARIRLSLRLVFPQLIYGLFIQKSVFWINTRPRPSCTTRFVGHAGNGAC